MDKADDQEVPVPLVKALIRRNEHKNYRFPQTQIKLREKSQSVFSKPPLKKASSRSITYRLNRVRRRTD